MKKRKLPYANKELGQHFLIDQYIIDEITNDFKDNASALIEIGPGPAILTENLSQLNIPYFVIEKDKRFKEYINQYLEDSNIIFDDALQVDLSEKIKEFNFDNNNIWLVSNLPYNISSLLLVKFLTVKEINFLTLMFQKEVALKILPKKVKKMNTMGSLCALTQNYFSVSLNLEVAPSSFNPPPKVDSSVLSFTRRPNPVIPLSEFNNYESFLRKLFSQRRKQVKKVLKSSFSEDLIDAAFEKIGRETTIRAEVLTLEEVQELFLYINKNL